MTVHIVEHVIPERPELTHMARVEYDPELFYDHQVFPGNKHVRFPWDYKFKEHVAEWLRQRLCLSSYWDDEYLNLHFSEKDAILFKLFFG